MHMYLFFILAGTCMASMSNDILVASLLDPEYANVSVECKREFMTREKTVDEYDEILDRLAPLYKQYVCASSTDTFLYTECDSKQPPETLPFLQDFVRGIPPELLVKFVLLPPGPLRQAIVGLKRVSAIDIFEFLNYYHLPYAPYINALKTDTAESIQEMTLDDLQILDNMVMRALSVFDMDGTISGFLNVVCHLMEHQLEHHELFAEIKRAICGKSKCAKVRKPILAQSQIINLSTTAKGIKRAREFSGNYQNVSVFKGLPVELEILILSQTGLAMRLVNKAASRSNVIPGGPSDPHKFLSVMENDRKNWNKLVYTCTGLYSDVLSPADIEMLKSFMISIPDLAKIYQDYLHDPPFILKQAMFAKLNPRTHAVEPDPIQWCFLSSIVFETGAFDENCNQVVRDQLLVVAKVFFPKQVCGLIEARKEHYNNGMDKLMEDSRVPWFWTFSYYSNLALIDRIFADQNLALFLRSQIDTIDRATFAISRMVAQRLQEVHERSHEANDLFDLLCIRLSRERLSMGKSLEVYGEYCESGGRILDLVRMPRFNGPLMPDFLLHTLSRSFDKELGKEVIGRYRMAFLTALNQVDEPYIPVRSILDILEFQSDSDIESILFTSSKYTLGPLISALIETPVKYFPRIATLYFSQCQEHYILEGYVKKMVQKGLSRAHLDAFLATLPDSKSEPIRLQLETSFPISCLLHGRSISMKKYEKESVIIRVVWQSHRVEVPFLVSLPGDASVLELYCRVLDVLPWKDEIVLTLGGCCILPCQHTQVSSLSNKKLVIVSNNTAMIKEIVSFLGF